MAEEVNNSVFSLFYLALLRKIVKENPENYEAVCLEVGKEIGQRIAEDFCAKHCVHGRIKRESTEKYIRLFFKTYFGREVEIKGKSLRTREVFEEYPGMWLFSAMLNETFQYLNSEVVFGVENNGMGMFYS
jgi:hypothetical protein